MTTCCVYAMCTSALVNGWKWFIPFSVRICVERLTKGKESCLYCMCVS